MQPERAQLRRLKRLERVRAIARETAAVEAAAAESTLARLLALAGRSSDLAGSYAGRADAQDAFALSQLLRFAQGLDQVARATRADSARAQDLADRKQAELAAAERRRALVEERALATARIVAARREVPALGARRASGTELD